MRWLALRMAALGLGVLEVACHSTLVGLSCTKHEECAALEEGYCARAGICTRTCGEGQRACPTGAHCHWEGIREVCLQDCADDAACRKGFACTEVAGVAGARVCRLVDPLAAPGFALSAQPELEP